MRADHGSMIVTFRTKRIRTLDDVRAFLEGHGVYKYGNHLTPSTTANRRTRSSRAPWSGFATTSACPAPARVWGGGSSPRCDWVLSGPIEPFPRAATPNGRNPRPSEQIPGAALPDRLHARRRPAAGRGRRGLRPAVRPGHQGDPAALVRGLRRRALRAPSPHLQRPHPQPAPATVLPTCPHHDPENPRCSLLHRSAAQAPSTGSPRLRAHRHRPHGRPRRREGGVHHQHGRRSDSVPTACGRPRVTEHFLIPVLEALITAFPSRFWASIPTTAPSTSTAGCSTSSTSASSPNRDPGAPTTTPLSSPTTATSSAGGSDAPTSPNSSPRGSTPSFATRSPSPSSSTIIALASSPSRSRDATSADAAKYPGTRSPLAYGKLRSLPHAEDKRSPPLRPGR